jgi:hypothetical protein
LFSDFNTTLVSTDGFFSSFSVPRKTEPNDPSPILVPFFILVNEMSIFGAFNSSWSTEPSWNARGVAFVLPFFSRRLRFFALLLDVNFC